jgi:hypothetical protein
VKKDSPQGPVGKDHLFFGVEDEDPFAHRVEDVIGAHLHCGSSPVKKKIIASNRRKGKRM